jgi:putative membrane protein
MKRFTVLALLAGVFLLSLVVAFSGAGEVVDAVASAGWATAAVVAARAVAIAATGLGWTVLIPPAAGFPYRIGILVRWIRESANQMLPVAQVGGDLIGARLATFWRLDGALAGASVIVDVAVQAGTQLLFALLGLGILIWLGGDSVTVRFVAGALAVAGLAVAAFFLVQRREGSRIIGAMLRKVAGGREWLGVAAVERLYARLGDVYANRRGVALSVAIHLAVWIFGSVEVWIALHFMGHPVSFAEAIVIESLSQAVRGAAFAVPGGLGVQEGGFVAICALFGIPPGPAVALSLVKRVADLAIGLPGILAWQFIEGRRALGRRRASASQTELAEGAR